MWRDRLRTEIRSGTFVDPDTAPPPTAPPVETRLTFGDVCDKYLEGHVRTPTRRPKSRKLMEVLMSLARGAEVPATNGATVRLEQKLIADVTKADCDAVRTWRRDELKAGRGRAGCKGGEVGINKLLKQVRHVFNWAIAEGHVTATPFKRAGVTVVKLTPGVEDGRTRRLDGGDEERRVLDHAGPDLRAIVLAALSTGCRIGELLTLTCGQVRRSDDNEARWLVLPGNKTKTGEARVLPVGAALRAVLSLRRHAPDGTEHGPTAFVFGDACGGPVSYECVYRTWQDAVLRAYGHDTTRTRGRLTPEARAAFKAIDLHVHDLRRASRLLESSASLHDVQAFLGHAAITTTSAYLKSTPTRLTHALDRLEAGRASFAHGSHTEASGTAHATATPTTAATVNPLH